MSSFSFAILSAAILARYFEKTEYGTYKQIVFVYTSMLVVFSAGLPQVFSYYLPRYSREQGKEIVNKLTLILIGLGLCFGLILFLGSGIIAGLLKNPDLEIGLKYFAVVPVFLLPTLGIEGIFATYRKTVFVAIYNSITRILMLLFIVVPVILFQGNYLTAIYGWVAVSILSFIIALYFKGIPFKGILRESSGLHAKEIFAYSLPVMLAAIGGMVMRTSDQFYISRYFGSDAFAEYANGYIQLPFVGMITGAASAVLMPIFSKNINDNTDKGELVTLWRSTLIKSGMLIYPMIIFFILNAEAFVTLLFSDLYTQSTLYFQIAMSINFFNIIIFSPLILALGKTGFYAKTHFIFGVLTWVFGFIVLTLGNSPYYIAMSSAVINVIMILTFIVFSAKVLNINVSSLIPYRKLVTLFIHSFVAFYFLKVLVANLLPTISSAVSLLLIGVVGAILLLFSGPILKLDYLHAARPFINKLPFKIRN